MKIDITPANAAALAKYAALSGRTSAEFLNRYLESSVIPLFENSRSGELESCLAALEYRTPRAAERVITWIGNRITERSNGRTTFKAEIVEDPENGCCWIDATTSANGLTYSV